MKKDHLAPLLLSLTAAEKKYFVQFASLRSDDKSYMKLYDCVLRDGEFNAAKLCKELKKTKANLAHEKEYLIENVMKALRNYHDKTKNIELNNLMSDALLLKERRLNELSMNRIKKATKLAEKYGRIEAAWRLKFEERVLALHLYSEKEFLSEAAASIGQMQQDLEWMKDFTELQKLYLQTETLYRTRSIVRNKTEEQQTKQLLKHPVLSKRKTDPQFRFYQLNIISSLQEQLKNEVNPLEKLRALLQLVEKHHERIPIDTYGYFLILHGYLLELVYNHHFAEFEKMMRKVKARYYHKLPFNRQYLDTLLDAHSYYYYLMQHNYLINDGLAQADKMKSFLADFEKNYEWVIKEFPPAYALLMAHYACSLCFYLKDYEAALHWNRKIINEGKPAERSEIQSIARIVTPILHAELKNYTILPSLVQTAKRYLGKTGYLTTLEKTTLAFLNKLPLLHNAAEVRAAFAALQQQYKQLEATEEGAHRLRTFKYRLWVSRNV